MCASLFTPRRHAGLRRAALLAQTPLVFLAAPVVQAPRVISGPPAQAQRRCLPLGGLLVGETTRRQTANGNEVTERFGPDLYRVTRCDRRGALIASMIVEPVDDPDGRVVLGPGMIVDRKKMVSIDYGDARDPRWAAAWRRVRDKVAASVTPPTPGTPLPDPAFDPDSGSSSGFVAHRGVFARAAADGACENGAYTENGLRWEDNRYPWYWNSNSFGGNYPTRDALELAHATWDETHTNCDYSDITTIRPEYKGSTTKHAGTLDGVGTADNGSVDAVGCTGALACLFNWYEGTHLTESDARFTNTVKWTTKGASGAYDYRAVATHE